MDLDCIPIDKIQKSLKSQKRSIRCLLKVIGEMMAAEATFETLYREEPAYLSILEYSEEGFKIYLGGLRAPLQLSFIYNIETVPDITVLLSRSPQVEENIELKLVKPRLCTYSRKQLDYHGKFSKSEDTWIYIKIFTGRHPLEAQM